MSNISNKWLLAFIVSLSVFVVIISLGNAGGIDSADIANESIIEEDLHFIDVPADGEFATYDSASQGFEWAIGSGGAVDISDDTNLTASDGVQLIGDDVSISSITTVHILDDDILLADLHITGSETDEFCVTIETGFGGGFEAQDCDGGAHPVNLLGDVTSTLQAGNGGTGTSIAPPSANHLLVSTGGGVYTALPHPDCDATISPQARLNFDETTSVWSCPNGTWDSADITDNTITSADILLDTILAIDIAVGGVGTIEILDDDILLADLHITGSETDEFCVTIETSFGGGFEAQNCGGGGSAIPVGRYVDAGLVHYSVPGVGFTGSSDENLTGDTLYYYPILTVTDITIDRIAAEVQSASVTGGATARLAIYEAGTDWQPGDLVVDAGTIATDSTGLKALTISEVLVAGRYLFAMISDQSDAAFRELRGTAPGHSVEATWGSSSTITTLKINSQSGAHTAMPDPGTAWTLTEESRQYHSNIYWQLE